MAIKIMKLLSDQIKNVLIGLFFLFILISVKVHAAEKSYEIKLKNTPTISYDSFSGQAGLDNLIIEIKPPVETDTSSEESNNVQDNTNIQDNNETPEVIRPEQIALKITPSNNVKFQLTNKKNTLPILIQPENKNAFTFKNDLFLNQISIANNTQQFEYQFTIPEQLYADAGEFNLNVDIVLINAISKSEISNKINTQIKAIVVPKLQTNLAGNKSRFEEGKSYAALDFGELTTGESQTVFIQIRGNALARIQIKSENHGKMVHQKHKQASIDYSVVVDGEFSNLSSPLIFPRTPARNLNGSAYSMKVTLGDVSKKYAGVYKDIINVDVKLQ